MYRIECFQEGFGVYEEFGGDDDLAVLQQLVLDEDNLLLCVRVYDGDKLVWFYDRNDKK